MREVTCSGTLWATLALCTADIAILQLLYIPRFAVDFCQSQLAAPMGYGDARNVQISECPSTTLSSGARGWFVRVECFLSLATCDK